MSLHLRPALLSAFVLPGLGQLLKGDRKKGGLLLVLVNLFLLAALAVVVRYGGALLLVRGTDKAAQIASIAQQAPAVRWLLCFFVILWGYGVIDALLAPAPPAPQEEAGETSPADDH